MSWSFIYSIFGCFSRPIHCLSKILHVNCIYFQLRLMKFKLSMNLNNLAIFCLNRELFKKVTLEKLEYFYRYIQVFLCLMSFDFFMVLLLHYKMDLMSFPKSSFRLLTWRLPLRRYDNCSKISVLLENSAYCQPRLKNTT